MRLGDLRIQLDGPLGRLLRCGVGLDAPESALGPELGVAASDPTMGEGEVRVQFQGIAEMAEGSSPDLCVKAEEAPRLRLGCLGDLLFLEE